MKRPHLLIAAGLAALVTSSPAALSPTLNANGRVIDVETPASGSFIDLAGMQALITARADLGRAAVLTGENASNGQTTLSEELAEAQFTVSGPNRYSRNDASAAASATSGGRFGLIDGSNTFTLGSKVPEVVTHFGAIFYNFALNGSANLVRATATFSDGTTAVYNATAGARQYTFVGFAAPAGTAIANVRIDEAAGGDWLGFDDLTVVLADPVALAGSTWTGAAGNGLWSAAGNWTTPPAAGSQLIFGESSDLVIANNLAAGIGYDGLFFPAESTGYEITGAALSPGSVISNFSPVRQSFLLPLQLQENLAVNALGPLDFSGGVSGAFGISKTGPGLLIVEGVNSYTGGTILGGGDLLVAGDHSAASGGWSIGIAALQSSRLIIEEGTLLTIAADKEFRIGSTTTGTSPQNVDVSGVVTNAGALHVGRPAFLNLLDNGTWSQGGPMTLLAIGGYDAHLTVLSGGEFIYGGAAPILLNPASGNTGKAYLTIDGGVFTTSAQFDKTTDSTGFSRITLRNNGRLKLAAALPELASGIGFLIGPDDGVIDTAGFGAELNAAVTGTGTLVKAGSGILAIGPASSLGIPGVRIEQGALSFLSSSLGGLPRVEIVPGGTLALDFAGEARLSALLINGVEQASGVWGAVGSGAPFESASITGSGTVKVSTDVSLASLSLSTGTLAPAFNPETTGYTAQINHTTTSITLTATASDANSVLTLNGAEIISGTASGPVPLSVGSNVIAIVNAAVNGEVEKTYTLNITRLGPPPIQWDLAANRIAESSFDSSALDVLANPPFVDQNLQGLRFVRDDTLAVPFGPENRFLQIGNPNVRFRTNVPAAVWGGVSTLAFDLFEPSGIGNTPVIFGLGGTVSGNIDINDPGAVFVFSLNNGVLTRNAKTLLEAGNIPVFLEDKAYRVAFLLNGGTNIADYADPADPENNFLPLLPGRMALWVKDLATGVWSHAATFTTTATIAPQQWLFRTFSNGNSQIYIDNFSVRDTLTVADPKAPPLWTGEGADDLWSNAANWAEGIAPVAGAPLSFGSAASPDSRNDLAAGVPIAGIEFNSAANGMFLAGNKLTLEGAIANASSVTQTIELDLALSSPLRLVASSGAIYLDGVISGSGALEKSGASTVGLFGENTYTGGTTVLAGELNISGNQSAANGGWSVGPASAAATVVNFDQTAVVQVGADKEFRIGNIIPQGNGNQLVNFSGVQDNLGSLTVGRAGILGLNSGAVWSQHGAMRIEAQGGFGARIEVLEGAALSYSGAAAILLNGASGNTGSALLNINGGTVITGAGFAQTTVPSTGFGRVTLANGGVLKASAAIPNLSTGVQIHFGDGGGSIDTAGFDVTMGVASAGSGSLVKSGAGTLKLLAGPGHAGDTEVSAGILDLGAPGLNDDAGVAISSGSKLHLGFDGEDRVASLVLGNAMQAPGTYHSTSHPAFFSGPGSLVVSPTDPFAAWIDAFPSLTNAADREKLADPDGDGRNNLGEFAFNSSPVSPVTGGKIVTRTALIGGVRYLTLTVPVRDGAVFTGTGGLTSQAIDGLIYRIRGSGDLLSFNAGVTEVVPALASDLPALDPGWSYRSFRLNAGISAAGEGFMRAEVSAAL